jgi:hypothetical protein
MPSRTFGLPPAPTAREIRKPTVTDNKSFPDIQSAYLQVLPAFLAASDNSLPARRPTKHQVVLIGILDQSLNTNKMIANSRSIKVASGISFTLDFSSTTA